MGQQRSRFLSKPAPTPTGGTKRAIPRCTSRPATATINAFWGDERHAGGAIDALLDAGADPTVRNAAGETPWDRARDNEALQQSDAYWRLNDARFEEPREDSFRRPRSDPPGRPPAEPPRPRGEPEDPTCEIPGHPSPTDVQGLGLSWCGSNVGFQRRVFALQAAGAWCAIAEGAPSSPGPGQGAPPGDRRRLRCARCAPRCWGAALPVPRPATDRNDDPELGEHVEGGHL